MNKNFFTYNRDVLKFDENEQHCVRLHLSSQEMMALYVHVVATSYLSLTINITFKIDYILINRDALKRVIEELGDISFIKLPDNYISFVKDYDTTPNSEEQS